MNEKPSQAKLQVTTKTWSDDIDLNARSECTMHAFRNLLLMQLNTKCQGKSRKMTEEIACWCVTKANMLWQNKICTLFILRKN